MVAAPRRAPGWLSHSATNNCPPDSRSCSGMRHVNVARALDEDLDTVEDDDVFEDTISIESGCDVATPMPLVGTSSKSKPPCTPTTWLQRLRTRLTWGAVTREEKRALRGHGSSASSHGGGHSGSGRLRHSPRRIQRQSTINVPTDLLLAALRGTLSAAGDDADDDDVAELSALLRLQLRHELQESSLWIVDAFDILAADTGGASTPRHLSSSASEKRAELEKLSDRFIDGLCGLMQRANYRLFSQREMQFAQSENFMFTLPVDVAWEDLDSGMISRLFVRHPHLGLHAALLARRVLVFHRGSGVATNTGYFWEEKLDLLLDLTFTAAFRRLYGHLLGWLCPAAAHRRAEELADAQNEKLTAASSVVVDDTTQRINLERLLPTLGALCCQFFSRLTIQEPTLQEVVVVYAELPGLATDTGGYTSSGGGGGGYGAKESSGGMSGGGFGGGGGSSTDIGAPVLRLKSFRDIPLADVEVVLPGLKVDRMKSADVVKLVVILLAGIASAVYAFISSTYSSPSSAEESAGGSLRGMVVYVTFFGLLLFRGAQTWCSVVNSKYTMNEFIRTTLYHRSQDSQRGVLLSIVNSIAQHELRESLTLYLLMRAHGRQLGAATHGSNSTPATDGRGAMAGSGGAAASGGGGGAPSDPPPSEDSFLPSSLLGGMLGSRRRPVPPGSGSSAAATPDKVHQASVARALADGCISLAEAESLSAHFFRTEFASLVHMHTAEALERLERLGLVHKAPNTADAARDGCADGGSADRDAAGGSGRGRPSHRKSSALSATVSLAAVPIADALATLRHTWGESSRVHVPAALAARNAPGLLMLTAPVHGRITRHSSHEGEISPEREPSARAPWLEPLDGETSCESSPTISPTRGGAGSSTEGRAK